MSRPHGPEHGYFPVRILLPDSPDRRRGVGIVYHEVFLSTGPLDKVEFESFHINP